MHTFYEFFAGGGMARDLRMESRTSAPPRLSGRIKGSSPSLQGAGLRLGEADFL